MTENPIHFQRTRAGKIITSEDEKTIVELYKSGIPASKIRVAINNKVKTDKTIYDILDKWEVRKRSGVADYNPITHDYFYNIDTKEKAYLLGFMSADGWIHPQRHQIGLSVAETDAWVVELLRQETKTAANIVIRPGGSYDILGKEVNRQPMHQLIMASQKMVEDLAALGVYENKTGREILPIINPHLQSHVLRGNLDGDGSIYLHSNGKTTCIRFLGSGHITAQVSLLLKLTLDVTYSFPSPKKESPNLYYVEWSKQEDCQKIAEYLYRDSDNLRIMRKYEKAQNLICQTSRVSANL